MSSGFCHIITFWCVCLWNAPVCGSNLRCDCWFVYPVRLLWCVREIELLPLAVPSDWAALQLSRPGARPQACGPSGHFSPTFTARVCRGTFYCTAHTRCSKQTLVMTWESLNILHSRTEHWSRWSVPKCITASAWTLSSQSDATKTAKEVTPSLLIQAWNHTTLNCSQRLLRLKAILISAPNLTSRGEVVIQLLKLSSKLDVFRYIPYETWREERNASQTECRMFHTIRLT